MRVTPEIERPGDALPGAILTDGLRGRQNVRFVEATVFGRPAVSTGAEAHLLFGVLRIGLYAVIRSDELFRVDENFRRSGLASQRMNSHLRGRVLSTAAALEGERSGSVRPERPDLSSVGRVSGRVDFHAPRPECGALRQMHAEHAISVFGLH